MHRGRRSGGGLGLLRQHHAGERSRPAHIATILRFITPVNQWTISS